MQPSTPEGILCAAVTPFATDGSVDGPALKDLIGYYARSGVQGIFGMGTAAEAMLLGPDERIRVTEQLVEALDGQVPLLLHCGTSDTASTIRLTRHAASLGVRAVAAIAPYYFAYGRVELEEHFRAVAEATPELELFVYDNPARVGYAVGVETIARLHRDVSSIVGVKDTGDSVGRVMRYLALAPPPHVYTGNNELVYATLAVGARGAVSALASAVPELVAGIYASWSTGDAEEAMRRQLTVVRLMDAFRDMPYLGAIKWLGRQRGLPTGRNRPPQPELDDSAARELKTRLAAVDGLQPWIAHV